MAEAEAEGGPPPGSSLEMVLAQFRVFDQNGDGTIDKTELLSIFRTVDPEKFTEERVQSILDAADLNKDSKIQYEEFVKFMSQSGEDQDDLRQAADAAQKLSEPAVQALVRTLSATSEQGEKKDLVPALEALHEMPWEKKEPAITLMLKLLQNVVSNPDNPKYRRLKRTNATLQAKIFSVPGCAELLMAAGFEPEGEEELVLPTGEDVQWVVDELTLFGNQELMDQKRAERDARIAKIKAEEAKGKELTGKVHSSDEERKKLLEKIEYDRQEREMREKLAAEGYHEKVGISAEKGGREVTRFSDIGVDVNRGGG